MIDNRQYTLQELFDMPEQTDGIEELVGNAPILGELVQSQNWVVAKWAYQAKQFAGLEGIRMLSKALSLAGIGKYAVSTLRLNARVWELYNTTRFDYPRLSFSYFSFLVKQGITGSRAIRVLKYANDREKSIPQLVERYGKTPHSEKCVCEKCGKTHTKNEPTQ